MLAGLLGLEPRLAEPESAVLPIERQPNNEVVYLSVSPSVVNGKCARAAQFFFHARNLLKSRDEALSCGCGAWPGGMPGAEGPPLRRGFANAKFRTMLGPSASDTRRFAPRAALTAAALPVRHTSFCLQAYAPRFFCSDSHQRLSHRLLAKAAPGRRDGMPSPA